jgi:small subunit ribosomal protein S20
MRQNPVRRQRNLQRKRAIKQVMKELRRAIEAGDKAKAEELVPQLMSAADKAAQRRAIHPNKAARIKSRWMRRLQEAFSSS